MDFSFWKKKRVLITGHTGFKGSWLSLWLHKLGANVYGYALAPNTKPSLFKLLDNEKKINHFIGDIRDIGILKAHIQNVKPDIIIHMAAQPLVRYSYDNPVETYEVNVMGTVNLLEAVRACDSVKVVINVTTDKCYENREWPWGYRENEPMGGHDPYSNSKGCSELVTSAFRSSYFPPEKFAQHGKAIASCRAGNVIGGGDWAADRLIPDIIQSLLNQKEIIIRNPASIRPWQHVLEPLSGYMLLAERMWSYPVDFSSAWNFGPQDNDAKPVQDIVEYFVEHWPQKAYWQHRQADKHEAQYLKLDISKAKQYLGWQPTYHLEQTLDDIIEWYNAHDKGEDIEALSLKQISNFQSKFLGYLS